MALSVLGLATALRAQTVSPPVPAPAPAAAAPTPAPTPTSPPSAWSLHAQSTYLYQWHYGFPSPYSGPNSFNAAPEHEATFSVSLYVGRRLWPGAALYFDPEIFQGHGLSGSVGIAGFTNGEAVKSGFPNLHYNTSRLYLQQVINLGGPTEKIDDGEDQLADQIDVNRLIFTVGAVSAGDFFDNNVYSHDSRRQFMNWALMESGAWDVPSDVVGYTAGAVGEWNWQGGELHYGIFMVPTEANGARLDHHLDQAFGQILEYDIRYPATSGQTGTVRPFLYLNRTYSGLFSAAADEAALNIKTTRAYRPKEGAGVSWDQPLSAALGVFARLSWNDGRTEDVSFTDIDRSAAAGVSSSGSPWGRPDDTAGLAFAVDGLAPSHRQYLAEGGTGFILGDGALNYGVEQIVELYYRVSLFGHLSLSPDWQYVEHPGYNRDRGGVSVYAVRAHLEF